MSIASIVLGESGTGKTTSLRNLNKDETLLIQAIKKPLPFKGWKWRTKDHPEGNIIVSDDKDNIIHLMRKTVRKIIILDDVQYIAANEFMRRSHEKSFEKFTDIGRNLWEILNAAGSLPDDVRVYLLWHTQETESGTIKAKTIGKLLDDKITIEGMVSIVIRTRVVNGQYLFTTQNNGSDTVKVPMGMFETDQVPNDLALVDAAIRDFYSIDTMKETNHA